MNKRKFRNVGWDDEVDPSEGKSFRVLSREEAQALSRQLKSVSPWRVVLVQVVVGMLVGLLAWLVSGALSVGWSALYGAAAVVVPGALMARGMTSQFSSQSPGAGALGFMVWELVKIGVSIAMLALASRVVQPVSWLALLVAMVLCMKVYWLALLWRHR
jgi:ATP synthase protein I